MSAVVYREEGPILELSASEWVFPILTPDERFTVLFRMKPCRSFSVKKFYDDMVYPRRERVGSDLVFKAPDYTPAKRFVDQHFIGMGGVTCEDGTDPTLEQQKKWLDEHEDFKVAIFRQGYDGISLAPSSNGNGHAPVDESKLVLFQVSGHKVASQWKLYSEERREAAELVLVHHLARITQQERHRHNQSVKLKENTRRNEQYIETNWDVVEQLYDAKIQKLEGALIEGVSCNEENRSAWCPQVPFTMKAFVVSQALQEIELKNA